MAKKRMFDNSVIDTDKFRNLGQSAKALYFMLGMDTDEDGFASFQKAKALCGFEIGDLKSLSDMGFVIVFPSGIVVITDFHLNNHLDKRWHKATLFQKELRELKLLPDKRYVQIDLLEASEKPLSGLLETTELAEQSREEPSRDGSQSENTMKTEEGAEKKTERSEEEIKKMRRENNAMLKKVEEELKNIGRIDPVPTVYID